MNHAAYFNTQFFRPAVDGVAHVAASCRLYTRPAGSTTTLQASYQDQAGSTPNANPIILDADGRCNLFLNPALEYLLELRTPLAEADALLFQRDDVVPAAATTGVVRSVNGVAGDVVFDAAGVPYVKSSSAAWLTATDVEAALDQIANRADAPPASAVTVQDLDGLFAAATVEAALAELATSSKLPSRTGNDGDVLALAVGALAWQRRETSYRLSVADGATASRTVRLAAGTWQISLDTRAYFESFSGDPSSATLTQDCTVGGQTVTTSVGFFRSGASGHQYRVHGSDIAIGSLVVGAEADFVMTIAAATLAGCVARGSTMHLEKLS